MDLHLHPKIITQYIPKLTIVLLTLCYAVSSAPNTGIKLVQCNSNSYSKGDPFAITLAYVLAELKSSTPTLRGYDFYNISPYPNAFAFGHAACSANLTRLDCNPDIVISSGSIPNIHD
ncbi:Receptor-like protein kinase-related family protein [Abeliophyllum distichum]|uniref:Receptor-like protein kinase-related family protein n=1 Tax=Abeliophyllum distichum TaxID=126358 RepID=A0ABD1TYJ2_9LAMI